MNEYGGGSLRDHDVTRKFRVTRALSTHENVDPSTSSFRPRRKSVTVDTNIYDDHGNRIVPVYKKSAKVKFKLASPTNADRIFDQVTKTAQSPMIINCNNNYLATILPVDSKPICDSSLAMSLLDDDVITAITDKLQNDYREFLFVNPCITQCILFAKTKQVPLFLDPLAAKKYRNSFYVVNGSRKTDGRGHWSLLVHDPPSRAFYHFDSSRDTNYRAAYQLSQKLAEYFDSWSLIVVRSEQQTNSTDCGYYVVDNILKAIFMIEHQKPLTQISSSLPSLINSTKNYVVNVYSRKKTI